MASLLPQSLRLIETLIGFDTTSRLSNLALIDFVADYLRDHGVAAHKIFDSSGKKANLYASIGPGVPGGIIFTMYTSVLQPFTRQTVGEILGFAVEMSWTSM